MFVLTSTNATQGVFNFVLITFVLFFFSRQKGFLIVCLPNLLISNLVYSIQIGLLLTLKKRFFDFYVPVFFKPV